VNEIAHSGQLALCVARARVRGTEDPPPPLDHVLHDGLGFKQVVACVEMKPGRVDAVSIQTQVVAGALAPCLDAAFLTSRVAQLPQERRMCMCTPSTLTS